VTDTGLGPLAARIPEVLRGSAAYHVPVPPNVIAKLDANELPYSLPADLRAQLAGELSTLALERYPDPTAKRLRAAISRQLGVAGERVVFGNGSDELIAMLCAAFAGPILVPAPTFVYYKLAAVNRGIPLVEVPLGPRFELDEDAMFDAVAVHQPSVVFLALPNNPTGGLWRMSFATELAARHRDVVVVSDEAYVAYSGATNLAVLDEHPNLVVMRTLSKLGMAGLRVGYVIASRSVASVLEKVRPPYNVSTLDQCAAAFLIDHASDWCAARAAEVVVERERLALALVERGFDVIPSQANLLLVKFADAAATWQQLFDRGISVRKFGPGRLADHLRITIGTPAENAAFLAALESKP